MRIKTPVWGALTLGLGLALAALAALAPGGTPPAATPASPPACPATPAAAPGPAAVVSVAGAVTIRLTDGGFEPASVEATNGHPLTIRLVNVGSRPHGFRLARYGIAVRLAPGATRTVTIREPDLGEYPFVSDAPCDAGMRGLLTFYI